MVSFLRRILTTRHIVERVESVERKTDELVEEVQQVKQEIAPLRKLILATNRNGPDYIRSAQEASDIIRRRRS